MKHLIFIISMLFCTLGCSQAYLQPEAPSELSSSKIEIKCYSCDETKKVDCKGCGIKTGLFTGLIVSSGSFKDIPLYYPIKITSKGNLIALEDGFGTYKEVQLSQLKGYSRVSDFYAYLKDCFCSEGSETALQDYYVSDFTIDNVENEVCLTISDNSTSAVIATMCQDLPDDAITTALDVINSFDLTFNITQTDSETFVFEFIDEDGDLHTETLIIPEESVTTLTQSVNGDWNYLNEDNATYTFNYHIIAVDDTTFQLTSNGVLIDEFNVGGEAICQLCGAVTNVEIDPLDNTIINVTYADNTTTQINLPTEIPTGGNEGDILTINNLGDLVWETPTVATQIDTSNLSFRLDTLGNSIVEPYIVGTDTLGFIHISGNGDRDTIEMMCCETDDILFIDIDTSYTFLNNGVDGYQLENEFGDVIGDVVPYNTNNIITGVSPSMPINNGDGTQTVTYTLTRIDIDGNPLPSITWVDIDTIYEGNTSTIVDDSTIGDIGFVHDDGNGNTYAESIDTIDNGDGTITVIHNINGQVLQYCINECAEPITGSVQGELFIGTGRSFTGDISTNETSTSGLITYELATQVDTGFVTLNEDGSFLYEISDSLYSNSYEQYFSTNIYSDGQFIGQSLDTIEVCNCKTVSAAINMVMFKQSVTTWVENVSEAQGLYDSFKPINDPSVLLPGMTKNNIHYYNGIWGVDGCGNSINILGNEGYGNLYRASISITNLDGVTIPNGSPTGFSFSGGDEWGGLPVNTVASMEAWFDNFAIHVESMANLQGLPVSNVTTEITSGLPNSDISTLTGGLTIVSGTVSMCVPLDWEIDNITYNNLASDGTLNGDADNEWNLLGNPISGWELSDLIYSPENTAHNRPFDEDLCGNINTITIESSEESCVSDSDGDEDYPTVSFVTGQYNTYTNFADANNITELNQAYQLDSCIIISENEYTGLITSPIGFDYEIPIPVDVYVSENGAYTDITSIQDFREKFKKQNATEVIRYVDFRANVGGDGLTMSTAYEDIVDAFSDGATTILINGSEELTIADYNTGVGRDARDIVSEVNIINQGGGDIIMGQIYVPLTFTQNATFPQVYSTTANNLSWLVDLTSTKISKGLYPHLTKVNSIAEVAANPSSYYDDGADTHIHLMDGSTPISGSSTSSSEPNIAIVRDNQNVIQNSEVYLEGITLYGRTVSTANSVDNYLYSNNSNFYYSKLDANTLDIWGPDAILYKTDVGYSYKDNINYDALSGFVTHVIEIDVNAHHAGYDEDLTEVPHQNSTAHSGVKTIRVGGLYSHGGTQNIVDINSGTQSWNIGIETMNNNQFGATTTSNVELGAIVSTIDAEMWVHNAKLGGSISSLLGGSIYVTGFNTKSNSVVWY